MEERPPERIAVLGSGNMGHGITEIVALAGYDVTMRDVKANIVDEGYDSIEQSLERLADSDRLDEDIDTVLSRIDTAVELSTAVADADIVIEAAPERMALKQDIFKGVNELTSPGTILATNTSSLSISEIASAVDTPEQVVGMHFFNPPVQMDLVEVIRGDYTSDETVQSTLTFAKDLGKTPIEVKKDVHGFVVNTILFPFLLEPAWMVSSDEATIRQADAAMVHQRGYPMGPFELADLTGLDVNYHVLQEANRAIPPIMADKVETEQVGRKAGRGYYDYKDGEGAEYEASDGEGFDTLRVEARMIDEAAQLVHEDVATVKDIDTGVRLGTGFPEGICERGDEIGLDTVLEKLETLNEETGSDRFAPSEGLTAMVEGGRTGVDDEAGFYQYD